MEKGAASSGLAHNELRYNSQLTQELWRGYLLTLVVGTILFPAGAVLDYFTQNSAFHRLFLIRAVATVTFAAFYLLAKKKLYPFKDPFHSGLLILSLGSFFISLMCMTLDGYQSPYYAGINLVMLVAGLFFPWGVKKMLICIGSVLGIYCVLTLIRSGLHIERPDIYVNNLYFLASTGTISLASSWLTDKLRRESFLRLLSIESAESLLREQDRLKTQFFANISHELRTPLTLILGPTRQLLAELGEAPGSPRLYPLQVIERNARALLKHVNDLLDIAKLEARKMEATYAEVDLAERVKRVTSYFNVMAEERGFKFEVETPSSVPAEIDPEKFDRVLMNLLANAFKFTPSPGLISVRLDIRDNRAVVEVSDSGPGIPAKLRGRIFERFFQAEESSTRHYSGTGLGLAIAKEFVEIQHGSIRAEESPLGGAKLVFDLPLAAPAGVTFLKWDSESKEDRLLQTAPDQVVPFSIQQEREAKPADSRERALVLVVEDSLEMNRYICEVLGNRYRVRSATSGQAALDLALSQPPSLIITDVMMPGMSGEEFVTETRALPALASVPIIVLTAKADDESRVRLLKNGATDYILKPFSPEELVARVANLISATQAQRLLQAELGTQQEDLEVLSREVTESRKDLRAALRVRDEFISIASHELNTPITSLKLQTELWQRRLGQIDDPAIARIEPELVVPELTRFVNSATRQIGRLTILIKDMLDVKRIEKGLFYIRPKNVNLSEIAAETAREYEERLAEAGCELRLELAPVAMAFFDPSRVEQLLANLLTNAAKYGARKPIVMRTVPTEAGARLEVQDHGIGIDVKDRQRIFEQFERAVASDSISGLGLGLYIVKRIVDAHKGLIRIESELGSGSTFIVELPHSAAGMNLGLRRDHPDASSEPVEKSK